MSVRQGWLILLTLSVREMSQPVFVPPFIQNRSLVGGQMRVSSVSWHLGEKRGLETQIDKVIFKIFYGHSKTS